MGAVLCVVTPAIYFAQSHFSPGAALSLWWLRLSPAYGPLLVWRGFRSGFGPGTGAEFWLNLGVTLAWSALCLGAASTALKLLWREREETQGSAGWRIRWRNLVHGTAQERHRLGQVWLEVNPFVWLAAREAARSMAEPRRDGTYELLLTTPLQPSDVVWGELEALRWHLQPVLRAVLGLEVLMLLAGLVVRGWSAPALAVYLTLWLFLLWWTRSLERFQHLVVDLDSVQPAQSERQFLAIAGLPDRLDGGTGLSGRRGLDLPDRATGQADCVPG